MKDPSNFKDTSYFEREDFNQPSYNMTNNKISKNRYEIKLSTNKVDFDFTKENIIPSPINIYVQNIGYDPIDCLNIEVTGNYKVTQDNFGILKPNGIKNIKIEYDSTKDESLQGSLNITAIDCIGNGFVIINGKTNPPDPIDPDNPDKDKDKDLNSKLSLKHFYPPVGKNKFVSGNNAQTIIFENDRYYSWFLYNENVDIHYKEDGKYLRNIDGGTSYAMITSKNLIDWNFRKIVIPKGIDLPKYNNSSLNTSSIGSGSVVKYKDLFYYYVTLADQNIALFTTDDIDEAPVFKQIVLNKQINTEVFHDPDVKYINNTFIMALGISDLTKTGTGINYYTSLDGINWTLKYFYNIPEFNRIDCPRIYKNVYDKDILIYNGINTEEDYKSEVKTYTGILDECSKEIFKVNSENYILDYGGDFYTPYLFQEQIIQDNCNLSNDTWNIYSWFGNWNYQALLPIEPVNGLFGVKKLNKDFNTYLHPNVIKSYNNIIKRKTVTYTGIDSNIPIDYLPETCVISIQIDKPLEENEYFALSTGSTYKAKLTKTSTGFKFQRKDWGNYPSFDTSLWDIEYNIPSDNLNTNIKLFLDKNSLEVIIDDKYYATFVLIYPLGAIKFISSFIIEKDNENNIIKKNSYTGSFELYYDHMANKVTGAISEEEVISLIEDKNYGCVKYPKADINEEITLLGVVKKNENCEVIKKVIIDPKYDCTNFPVMNTEDYTSITPLAVAKKICKEEDKTCKEDCVIIVQNPSSSRRLAGTNEGSVWNDGVTRTVPDLGDRDIYSVRSLADTLRPFQIEENGKKYCKDSYKYINMNKLNKCKYFQLDFKTGKDNLSVDAIFDLSVSIRNGVGLGSIAYLVLFVDQVIYLANDGLLIPSVLSINNSTVAIINSKVYLEPIKNKGNHHIDAFMLPVSNGDIGNAPSLSTTGGKGEFGEHYVSYMYLEERLL